jgi:flagellar motor protein MotB
MKRFTQGRGKKSSSESWQTIYMDLMTMIMVFFVILWSINKGKDIGISETVGNQTARMISLPGDVLFPPSKVNLSDEGKKVFKEIFGDPKLKVLNFKTNALVKRMLFIHGHTDSDGKKAENFDLGYKRSLSAYKELLKYNDDIPDHVVICTHADNTAQQLVPKFKGSLSKAQRAAVRSAKSKNRRITIEDKVVNRFNEK